MNKTESKLNVKTLLTFLTMLMLTFVMVFAIACNNGESSSDSSSDSSSESTSEEAKKDVQFLKNGDFEFSSSTSYPATPSNWSYTTDGAPYATTSTSSRGMIDTETTAYEKLSSSHKNEGKNPGTPVSTGKLTDNEETDANEAGTKVLMLHSTNYTAHYYTSSTSLTLTAEQYAKLSVWVRTDDISTKMGAKSGAYIKVKNNVVKEDSVTYDPLMIKNIDTKGEWVNYVIYLAPNQTKATTFTLVLGLGQGNKHITENLCNGYAYFDNVIFDYISKDDYTNATANVTKSASTAGETFIVDTAETPAPTVKLNLTEGTASALNIGGNGEFNKVNINNPTGNYEIVNKGTAGFTSTDVTVDGNTFNNAVYMDFSSLKNIGSSYTYTSDTFTLANQSYVRISFYAKISARSSDTKATMSIYDVAQDKVVASFDNVSTSDYENEHNGDFARYTFYIANNFVANDFDYQIKLSFGPTERSSVTDIKTLPIGYAIFKDFEIENLDKDTYDLANTSTDTRAKKGSLIGQFNSDYVEDEDDDEDNANDSYSITVGQNASLRMEEGEIVSLDDLTSVNLYTPNSDKVTVGVVNSKYVDKYGNALLTEALNTLKGRVQNSNKNVQALLVQNTGSEKVYVAANNVTVAANATYTFSIKVYAHASANAYVNIINMGDAFTSEKAVMKYNVAGDYAMEVEVANADSLAFLDGYAQVTFIITAGKEPLNLRLEFGLNGQGLALFDSIVPGNSSSSYADADSVKSAFEDDFVFATTETYKQEKIYYYANETDAKNDTNRLKDSNKNDRYEEGEEFDVATFGTLNGKTAKLVQYYRYDTVKYLIDESADSSDESTSESVVESTDNSDKNLVWLQVTSIIIALVLVGALVAIIVRKVFAKNTRKKNKTKTYYHQGYNKNNRYTKDNDVAVPDAEDAEKEYDYDNPENN